MCGAVGVCRISRHRAWLESWCEQGKRKRKRGESERGREGESSEMDVSPSSRLIGGQPRKLSLPLTLTPDRAACGISYSSEFKRPC